MDKSYWNQFYKKRNELMQPSTFAVFCHHNFLLPGSNIIELGSGDGRDSIFFAKEGHFVTGLDQSEEACSIAREKVKSLNINSVVFNQSDFTKDRFENYKEVDGFYSRFTLHSINEFEEDRVLENVSNKVKKGALFLIEARTIKDPLMGEGERISDNEFMTDHYRRFLDPNLLVKKCIDIGFKIEYRLESDNLSVVGEDNPVLLRLVLRK